MKKECSFFRFIIHLSLGVLFGLLFAQKTGKELRKKLSKSKTPYRDLLMEIAEVKMDYFQFAKEKFENFLQNK